MVGQLEQQLARQRTNLAHLDAMMRLFDPDIRPQEIRAKQQRARSAWFRKGECLRRIYDELRNAAQPLTTRDLAERIMRAKAVPAGDDRSRELIQKSTIVRSNYILHMLLQHPDSCAPIPTVWMVIATRDGFAFRRIEGQ
jgi:hypothetical protein